MNLDNILVTYREHNGTDEPWPLSPLWLGLLDKTTGEEIKNAVRVVLSIRPESIAVIGMEVLKTNDGARDTESLGVLDGKPWILP